MNGDIVSPDHMMCGAWYYYIAQTEGHIEQQAWKRSPLQRSSCSSSHYYKDDDPPLSFHEINSPIIIIPAQIICVGNVFRGKSEFRPSRDCFINGVASSLLCWSTFFVYQEKIYRKSGTQQLTQGLKCIFCNEKLSIWRQITRLNTAICA
jgi:hypothetical protein